MSFSLPNNKDKVESPLQAIYNSAPCGIVTFQPDGLILTANRTLLNWIQATEDEVVGRRKFSSVIAPGGIIHYEMFFRPLLAMHGSVTEINYDIISADGVLMPVLVNAEALKNDAGHVVAINAVVFKISDRKNFEKELVLAKKQAETEVRRFQFLADLNPEIIWTAGPDGVIDYVNLRFYIYFSYSKKKISIHWLLAALHPDERSSCISAWQEALSTGNDFKLNLRLRKAGHVYEWHTLKANAFKNEEGKIIKWVGSCANIQDYMMALKEKDQFISIASHELKTPMTSLKAATQLMARFDLRPQSDGFPLLIAQANKNVDKVIALINDLLDVTHMREGQLHLHKELFNLTSLVRECLHPTGIEIHDLFVITGDPELMVRADPNRVEQVITNLINNAVKYAAGTGTIRITVEHDQFEAVVSVRDNGPGIPQEKQARLFDRFYRADNASAHHGLGLGLFICAEIIRKHGGRIGVSSGNDQGSNFWFSLPLGDEPTR